MESTHLDNIVTLPRGGLLIKTENESIQFGIPPETIKDTMQMKSGVPTTFIIPQFMFIIDRGISLSELEFPTYFNFFIRQSKAKIVCLPEQHQRLKSVMQEALFGPEHLDYTDEFSEGENTPGFPDLRAELNNFRTIPMPDGLRPFNLEDAVEFILFDTDGIARLDNLEICVDQAFNYKIVEKSRVIARIDRYQPLIHSKEMTIDKHKIFRPPMFGITALGSGHGFDPNADTSGMIIWVNRRGIIVDPPVNSTNKLLNLGVNPKLIDSVILTHCHADHDAGTLQKIMQEGRLSLYTTSTIFNSFIRKSSALTGIHETKLRNLIRFFPVTIGESMNINGGDFEFSYTIHSIPTIGIKADFKRKTMVYSSDTMNDPEYLRQLHKKGVLSDNRLNFLLDFPWDRDVIFHEAGIPPIHTPIEFLLSLPEDVRKRMYLAHVSPENIPENSDLKIAPSGLNNTVDLETAPSTYDEVMEILSILMGIDIFSTFNIEKAREFLAIANKVKFSSGDIVFKKGDPGDEFFIIMRGRVEIASKGEILTLYSDGDYFGEKALFMNEVRTASATAVTDTVLLSIHKKQMMQLIRGTTIEQTLYQLATAQNQALREELNANIVFSRFTPTQQTQLYKIIEPVSGSLQKGHEITREDSQTEYCYFVRQGSINVFRKNVLYASLGRGELFGIAATVSNCGCSHYTYTVNEQAELYKIPRALFKEFLQQNPGVYIKLFYYDY